MKKVAVILPTFNEKKNIEWVVKQILKQSDKLPNWQLELVIVDSNSPDGTGKIAKSIAVKNKYIHFLEVGRGLGIALIEGDRYALKVIKPDILAQIDADGQVGVEVLPRLIRAVESGADLAIGSRFVKGGKNHLPLSRRFLTIGSSWVCRLLMGPMKIREFTNSARAFTPALFAQIDMDRLPWQEKTFVFLPAFVYLSSEVGAKIVEVPLVFKKRGMGYSKNKVMQYSFDLFSFALDVRLQKMGINAQFYQLARSIKSKIKLSK